ncbi:MAG: hypothetical protein K2X60_09840 [Xanthobacteraceae bacterium]|nr:hypothetical protein [Xanthobacteraceae bacterium]
MSDIALGHLTTRLLQFAAFSAGGLGTMFWIYTFYAIAHVPLGDGTGFQWLGEVPLTGIFILLTFPTIALAFSGRMAPLAALLGVANLVALAVVWLQLLSEFPVH